MKPLRFALIGAGFWSRYQLAGWRELPGVECVAVLDRTPARAAALAREFNVPAAYGDAGELLDREALDFVDIVTDVDSHPHLVRLAAERGIAAICQKPMAPSRAGAEAMVTACREAGTALLIHENWRWQTPVRELKRVLETGVIGRVFRAGMDMISGFPLFENQPFLADLERFILADLGSHTLDTARFLFGEARSVYCRTARAHPNIRGEDVATVVLDMAGPDEVTVVVRMAYAGNFVERECFPQTLFFIEGTLGSIELAPDYWLLVTTRAGTRSRRVPPPFYPWADPRYAVVHASIVPCHADLLAGLRGGHAETTGGDNLKTVQLVWGAYDSAASGNTVRISS